MIIDSYLEVFGRVPSNEEMAEWLLEPYWKSTNELIGNHVRSIKSTVEQKPAPMASVGENSIFPNPAGIPDWHIFPDANMSVLPLGGKYYAWWSEFKTYRTYGDSAILSDQKNLSPNEAVAGGIYNSEVPYNSGTWITDVYRGENSTLVGFSHIEYKNSTGRQVKSMAVSTSSNGGEKFSDPREILTASRSFDVNNKYQGLGDGCVVKDYANDRFIAFFSEVTDIKVSPTISMAVSYDPNGAPGTWKKWHNGDFTEDGLGGQCSPIAVLSRIPGSNPSVHFNTWLSMYVMVFASWENGLFISYSKDLITWSDPAQIIKAGEVEIIRYPTVIGNSSNFAGQTATLYYAENVDDESGKRDFVQTTLNFEIRETQTDSESSSGGCSTGVVGLVSLFFVTTFVTLKTRKRS
jgi:hypothetical protein